MDPLAIAGIVIGIVCGLIWILVRFARWYASR